MRFAAAAGERKGVDRAAMGVLLLLPHGSVGSGSPAPMDCTHREWQRGCGQRRASSQLPWQPLKHSQGWDNGSEFINTCCLSNDRRTSQGLSRSLGVCPRVWKLSQGTLVQESGDISCNQAGSGSSKQLGSGSDKCCVTNSGLGLRVRLKPEGWHMEKGNT